MLYLLQLFLHMKLKKKKIYQAVLMCKKGGRERYHSLLVWYRQTNMGEGASDIAQRGGVVSLEMEVPGDQPDVVVFFSFFFFSV